MATEFDFEKYFNGMNGWSCKICGDPFPPDASILEEHYDGCKGEYIAKRVKELEDEVIEILVKNDLATEGGWVGLVKNVLGEKISEEYEILTLQERIPDKQLEMGISI